MFISLIRSYLFIALGDWPKKTLVGSNIRESFKYIIGIINSPFYKLRNVGSERLNYLSKVAADNKQSHNLNPKMVNC